MRRFRVFRRRRNFLLGRARGADFRTHFDSRFDACVTVRHSDSPGGLDIRRPPWPLERRETKRRGRSILPRICWASNASEVFEDGGDFPFRRRQECNDGRRSCWSEKHTAFGLLSTMMRRNESESVRRSLRFLQHPVRICGSLADAAPSKNAGASMDDPFDHSRSIFHRIIRTERVRSPFDPCAFKCVIACAVVITGEATKPCHRCIQQ